MLSSAALLLAIFEGQAEPQWPKPTNSALLLGAGVPVGSHLLRKLSRTFGHDDGADDEALIRQQPICIGSSTWSWGTLGDVVLFTHVRHGNELRVGYFVYWNAERPWGTNALTYSLLPALAIDAVYSHFLFVLPGVRHMMYGAGDIEGAAVIYEQTASGTLTPQSGLADDYHHHAVTLSRADLAMTNGNVSLMTNFWSHQLGARGASAYAENPDSNVRCFSGPSLQPLTRGVAERFRIGSAEHPLRGRPAWRAVTETGRPTSAATAISLSGVR